VSGDTHQIMEELLMVKVIALSVHSDKHIVKGMLRAGASAYLSKYSASQELIKAIRLVMANQIYLSPRLPGLWRKTINRQDPIAPL